MAVVEAVYFGGKEPCNNRAPASGEDYDPSGVHALADGALPRALPWRPVLLRASILAPPHRATRARSLSPATAATT